MKRKQEIHGMRSSKVYKSWASMKQRCTNPNNVAYKNYGERGIMICEEWLNSFIAYYNFVSKLENYGVEGYTLDRINNDKGYYPVNVKYSTESEQRHNQRNRNGYGNSKFKGVCQNINTGKWIAYKQINGHQKYIGVFLSESEALQAVSNSNKIN